MIAHKPRSRRKSSLESQKPNYVQAVKAVNYWVLFDDLASYFERSGMPVVSHHLSAACQEIDRIWEESDYSRDGFHTC